MGILRVLTFFGLTQRQTPTTSWILTRILPRHDLLLLSVSLHVPFRCCVPHGRAKKRGPKHQKDKGTLFTKNMERRGGGGSVTATTPLTGTSPCVVAALPETYIVPAFEVYSYFICRSTTSYKQWCCRMHFTPTM